MTLEFRGSDIRGGKRHWRGIGKEDRKQAYLDALELLARSTRSDGVRLFGVAADKVACSPDDPMEYAFEQICSRFDRFLTRLHHSGNTQRGLIILDKSSYETSLQGLAKDFARRGHRWGNLHNISEVPLFVDSTATRLIQFADLIAHALRLNYDRHETELFNVVAPCFDAQGGVIHGLYHKKRLDDPCHCPYCCQRSTD